MSDTVGPTTRRTAAHTVVGALEEQAERFPDDPFVITPDDRVITFASMRARALELTAGLCEHGVEAGASRPVTGWHTFRRIVPSWSS
jgi:non-ribosomal peptide synthetase component E (peptide arylation enzyme)